MFLISRIQKLPYTFLKNNTFIEDRTVNQEQEENEAYTELINQEQKSRYEELLQSQKSLERLLTKELHLAKTINNDNNYTEAIKQLELLNHNTKGFISTLQNARIPHQARPSRQR